MDYNEEPTFPCRNCTGLFEQLQSAKQQRNGERLIKEEAQAYNGTLDDRLMALHQVIKGYIYHVEETEGTDFLDMPSGHLSAEQRQLLIDLRDCN